MNNTARRVALLARPGVARDRMREALDLAGANIVLEADPATTDQDAVLAAQPEAALIVLDAATDEALDRFDGVLSNPRIEVFFEEAELAIGRVGWDAARWVRHLRAKLLHSDNVLPPGRESAAPSEAVSLAPASPELAPAAVTKLELSLADVDDGAPVDARSVMELVAIELGDEAPYVHEHSVESVPPLPSLELELVGALSDAPAGGGSFGIALDGLELSRHRRGRARRAG